MTTPIEERLWLSTAKGMPAGESTKIIHKGCGQRPSLFVMNDDDAWWCYCHRCRRPGNVKKLNPRIKNRHLSKKTGWKPAKLMPALAGLDIILEKRGSGVLPLWFAANVSVLNYSPDTERLYFLSDDVTAFGYDVSGLANARFYSPLEQPYAVVRGKGVLWITSDVSEYLVRARAGLYVFLAINKKAEQYALAEIARVPDGVPVLLVGNFNIPFIRSAQALGAKLG